jgi:hypothetical protein
MQHIGDLQPFGPPDYLADHAPLGRYSAKRSRWRFAVGSLEVGFDRATEQIQAETPRTVRAAPRADFGRRLMVLVGTLTTSALILALAGWLWSNRGETIFGGETVSASIVDRNDAIARDRVAPATGTPIVIPTEQAPARLTAVIEQRKPAPMAPPARRAAVPIADGQAIQPRAAPDAGKATPAPDEAIVSSGNFLLIPNVARAVGQAMTSGEAQSWAAGTYHGLVVVGDVEPRGGKSCRQGTVLLRDGSNEGRTQKFERCAAIPAGKSARDLE